MGVEDVLGIVRVVGGGDVWRGGLWGDDVPVVLPAWVCRVEDPDCSGGPGNPPSADHPIGPDPWDDGEGEEEGGGGPPSTCIPPGSCECADADDDGLLNYLDCDSPCYVGDPATDCACRDDDDDGTINQDECFDPCGGARSAPGECVCAELGVGVSIDQACEGDPPLVWVLPDGEAFPQSLGLSAAGTPAGGTYEWRITSGEGTVVQIDEADPGNRASVILDLLGGGMASVEVTYTIDFGGVLVCEATDQIELAIVESLRLERVRFGNDHAVTRDSGVAYATDEAEWLDENLDGDVDDEHDHHWPVCYRRNTAVTVSEVAFKALPDGLTLGDVV